MNKNYRLENEKNKIEEDLNEIKIKNEELMKIKEILEVRLIKFH